MLPLWEGEATLIEKWSKYEIIRYLGIDICLGASYRKKTRGEMGDPWGVPTESGERRLGEPWKTRVQVFSERKEDKESTL